MAVFGIYKFFFRLVFLHLNCRDTFLALRILITVLWKICEGRGILITVPWKICEGRGILITVPWKICEDHGILVIVPWKSFCHKMLVG